MRNSFLIVLSLSLTACQPTCEESGRSWYFQRHELHRDRGTVRMYPIYECRPVPADR